MKRNSTRKCRESDPQQDLEYTWEAVCIEPELPGGIMSLDACEKIAKRICRRHRVAAPLLLAGRKGSDARSLDFYFQVGKRNKIVHVIQLPREARNLVTVVHECCHFLKHHYDEGSSHHGPVFVRLMIDEISRIGRKNPRLSKRHLVISARAAGLVVCDARRFNYNKEAGHLSRSCTECMRMYP